MERLLKASPWQIFILLIIGLFLMNYSIENDQLTTSILSILGLIICFIYPFAVGCFLQDYLPKKIESNYNFFLINSFIWLMTYSTILIVSDGKGMTFNGLSAIPMFYVFYAFMHFLTFPVKTLKSIELNRKVGLGDYIGDFFLILFLPIGIWFLQPRIRQVIDRK